MQFSFEEELGIVAVRKRLEGELAEVPKESRDAVSRLLAVIPELPLLDSSHAREVRRLTFMVDGNTYSVREGDIPSDLREGLRYLRANALPTPFTNG